MRCRQERSSSPSRSGIQCPKRPSPAPRRAPRAHPLRLPLSTQESAKPRGRQVELDVRTRPPTSCQLELPARSERRARRRGRIPWHPHVMPRIPGYRETLRDPGRVRWSGRGRRCSRSRTNHRGASGNEHRHACCRPGLQESFPVCRHQKRSEPQCRVGPSWGRSRCRSCFPPCRWQSPPPAPGRPSARRNHATPAMPVTRAPVRKPVTSCMGANNSR